MQQEHMHGVVQSMALQKMKRRSEDAGRERGERASDVYDDVGQSSCFVM